MPTPFRVDTAVFAPFAASCDTLAQELDAALGVLAAAAVDRGSFGLMPASDDLFGAYEQHVTAALDGMRDTSQAMHDVSAAATASAANYDGAEVDAVASFRVGG